jgi:hypothetical protein
VSYIKKNDGIERWLEIVETLRDVTEEKMGLAVNCAELDLTHEVHLLGFLGNATGSLHPAALSLS